MSKLLWAKDTHSDLQLRDVRNLLDGDLDRPYLEQWALTLGIVQVLKDLGT